jgi:hypothetical protein
VRALEAAPRLQNNQKPFAGSAGAPGSKSQQSRKFQPQQFLTKPSQPPLVFASSYISERSVNTKTEAGIGITPQKPNGGFMKKNLGILSMVVVLGLMAVFSYAGAGIGMRINVPFDFYFEDQLFPTGEYSFEMNSSNLATASQITLWSLQGPEHKLALTTPGTEKNTTVNQLSFNKYGQKYFLSMVSIGGHKATVKMFKLEKELRAQMEKNPATITVAQK